MFITAEKFSEKSALSQGFDLHTLVEENEEWLGGSYYAGAKQRYGAGKVKAVASVLRLARSSHNGDLKPFVLHFDADPVEKTSQKFTVGIGTVILGRTVQHPETGRIIHGADVDFWLHDFYDNSMDVRDQTARAMVAEARKLAGSAARPEDRVFTAVAVGPDGQALEHQPVGVEAVKGMEPIGGPAQLSVPAEFGPDQYDIAKADYTVQLYAARMIA